MFKGFKEFVFRGNVIDLAVAVVIGAAFGKIVNALVADLITPLIGVFGGVPNFSVLNIEINGSKFLVGDFVNALLSFLIISAVVYFLIILPMNKVTSKNKKKEIKEKNCPECLSSIPLLAKKCKFCGSKIK